jgi:hypothetical protein
MSMTDLLSQPTYRSTRGRVPVFRPQLNGEDFPVTITQAAIQHVMGMHDAAILKVSSSELTTTDGIIGSPIAFFYGQAPRTELFCGYVVNIAETQAGKGSLTFAMNVFGATQPMQIGKPRYWTRKTVPAAVENLAYSNALGYHGHDHTHAWGSLAQTSESDWLEAVALTDRLGWGLFNRFGVLMCYDPAKLFQEQGVYATLMSSDNQAFDPVSSRRLIEFHPSEVSDNAPKSLGTKVAYFDNKGNIQIATQRGDYTDYKFRTGLVIGNPDEAVIYTSASKVPDWKQQAEATMWGDVDIFPGMLVDVVTMNTRYLQAQYDGRWLVHTANHMMDSQQFQTQLLMSRPASDAPVSHGSYRSYWEEAGKSRPTLSLQEGKWISSWTDLRVRDVL